ncbi:large ribosomal subunit protein mL54 [Procambarus clarkii]|uniref:large ribosomal subunit protein mL54 n=1 Tax=Procambarus clarkii TaxID=6728 RepID=UPI001E6724D6|nr:39S ribosomal protein L54, mitochondrial-like [Procambarus clarkii]
MAGLRACAAALRASWTLSFTPTCSHLQRLQYSRALGGGIGKKGKGKIGPTIEKVHLPVETDPVKLVTYVCGSHPVKENREDVKIKDDSEYPDWLWTLRTGKPPPLEELDPNTKAYWKRLRHMAMKEKNLHMKLRKF